MLHLYQEYGCSGHLGSCGAVAPFRASILYGFFGFRQVDSIFAKLLRAIGEPAAALGPLFGRRGGIDIFSIAFAASS
jgi:hypothetical protein